MFKRQFDRIACIDNAFIFRNIIRSITVRNYSVVDVCAGISAGINKAYFPNHTVKNVSARSLLQFICINTQILDVAMAHSFSCILTVRRIVKISVRIDTFRPVFKQRMA